jgi:SAM-dependent methyltransferase
MTPHTHDHGQDGRPGDAGTTDLASFWEERYAGSGQVWSGRVNPTFADVVGGLAPGRALDLGCGEGGDVIWLAAHGWQATGVDVSPTAVARAARAALDAGLGVDRARFVAHDLSDWRSDARYELVCASFFHSPVDFPRTEVLRRAAALVAPGGHLLVVSHAAFPPWSDAQAHGDHVFLSPDEERAELALDPASWTVVLAETRQRPAIGPEGQQAVLDDGVLLLRRD